MRLPDDELEFILGNCHAFNRLGFKGPGLRRFTAMTEGALLRRPLDPAAVEHLQILMAEIFQHPEHAPFVAPVIEGIGVDDDFAVVADSQGRKLPLDLRKIRIQEPFRNRIGIAVFVPGRMNGAGNVAAELIGRFPPDIDNHQSRLAEPFLQRFRIHQ